MMRMTIPFLLVCPQANIPHKTVKYKRTLSGIEDPFLHLEKNIEQRFSKLKVPEFKRL